jgi:TRAP-type C4-dicarboxylate transport system permease large subunit
MPIFMQIIGSVDFGIGNLQQTQVWFGVLALMMLEISLATPPFGLLLFVAKGVAPSGTTMGEVITSVLPFILMAMAVAALLVFVPSITLLIPNLIAR